MSRCLSARIRVGICISTAGLRAGLNRLRQLRRKPAEIAASLLPFHLRDSLEAPHVLDRVGNPVACVKRVEHQAVLQLELLPGVGCTRPNRSGRSFCDGNRALYLVEPGYGADTGFLG